jgi:hypothetical protein
VAKVCATSSFAAVDPQTRKPSLGLFDCTHSLF